MEAPDNKTTAKPTVLHSPGSPRHSSAPFWVPTPSPGAPHPQGGAPTPAAAQGNPQHPVEILAPASVADGDKDKTTPPLINKGPDSAASIRQSDT